MSTDTRQYKNQNTMTIMTQDSKRHDMNTDTRNNINTPQ